MELYLKEFVRFSLQSQSPVSKESAAAWRASASENWHNLEELALTFSHSENQEIQSLPKWQEFQQILQSKDILASANEWIDMHAPPQESARMLISGFTYSFGNDVIFANPTSTETLNKVFDRLAKQDTMHAETYRTVKNLFQNLAALYNESAPTFKPFYKENLEITPELKKTIDESIKNLTLF